MSVLLLRLAGPMQAWGDSSRFNHRGTRREPTKSGVAGLLAAAQGRRRTDPLEDLANLRFAVRTDQVGRVERDFHTSIDWRVWASNPKRASKPLTNRDYLTDACFVVGVEGPQELIESLAEAVRAPVFPLYLGRRACPPSGRVLLGVEEGELDDVLRETPWQAADWYRKRMPKTVQLSMARDAAPGERADEMVADVPVSFDPTDRRHGMRGVVHGWVTVNNDAGRPVINDHDPFALLGGE
ncbi:type I-E CRISPR-associated protein Cas5/CasD [Corynebacterium freneyi]|uniref:CRISPR-associated protein Cas5 n=1 Tax=Corynebacterium freneyi DNF00450 TaxID=1287475 RepID=A0A096A302_9CORY|nr:type I-E CRISPR-associated protein Cas5/CasD [Corynebacterium freneyi]KGF15229.1 CRISPR-associated protein Cas5 [Corynebacterium freneyi DNF00450]